MQEPSCAVQWRNQDLNVPIASSSQLPDRIVFYRTRNCPENKMHWNPEDLAKWPFEIPTYLPTYSGKYNRGCLQRLFENNFGQLVNYHPDDLTILNNIVSMWWQLHAFLLFAKG